MLLGTQAIMIMDLRYLLILLFLLSACMPSTTPRNTNLSSTGTTTAGSTTGGGVESPSQTSWNYLSAVSKSISLNKSNLTNSYIIGVPVETFLAVTNSSGSLVNFTNKSYCVVTDFTISGYTVQHRAVATPISYYDFSAKKTVRALRVDFNEVVSSSNACNKPLMALNASSVLVPEAAPAPSAINASGVSFDISTICSSCALPFNSSRVRLFDSQTMQLEQVLTSKIDISPLAISIDPSNNSNSNNPSCTNASCQSTGYSCCLDNQCVNEGAIRPTAYASYPQELAIAEEQKISNPLVYKNYPQLYYVCGSSVPTNPGSTSGSTTGSTPDPYAQINADYLCIQEIKSHTSSVPYNNDFLNTGFSFTGSVCNTSDTANTNYFKTVMQRLYSTCGCLQTGLVAMVNNCPAYDYRKDANNVVECYVQEPPVTNPVTYKNVNLPSRSAPHRYFNTSGVEEKINSATSDQEGQTGESFAYVDENKLLYTDTKFSMKAILGNFSRTLDQAQPAVQVDVEVDQVYLLSTVSGFFTPCPNCGKDSWFTNFSAFPTSTYGTGLQAIGHTTQRDTWSTNTTGGNYEDTIFGRACWVPPTMLPFSHKAIGSTTVDPAAIRTQRLARLKTQAALFANGYQRDWYGFNKGAIIGSFDGVTWFAIGKGRIVRSTSKKLFLAINAPFADLASPTTNVVNVQSYDGLSQATQLDYDPTYHQSHNLQNEAGNCQYHHQCNVDADCVTKLGWEYMCGDVNGQLTTWPKFDVYGAETGESQTMAIEQILLQKRFGGTSTKRCVYRGAGSICHTNSNSLTPSTDFNKKKMLSCAPNFYCSPLTAANFNTKVARWASAWEEIPVARNHTFGREANILGRPRDYISAETVGNLESPIADNIKASFDPSIQNNLGLCLPGKNLPAVATASTMWNPFEQQKTPDPSKRTDFINQISSCNSTLFGQTRHTSCPVLNSDGSYVQFTAEFLVLNQTSYSTRASAQNACGLETLYNNSALTGSISSIQDKSPFKNIEAKTLAEQTIVSPTLVRDACLRRAGEVCHTDLDCSPNKFHASEADLYGVEYFGNFAEQQYHQEYLVCGQSSPQPLTTDGNDFKNFDMTKNRCCREVGKDITTFTPNSPNSAKGDAANTDTPESRGLVTSIVPGLNPSYPLRYSRFATVSELGQTDKPYLTAQDDRISASQGGLLSVLPNVISRSNIELNTNQWKTLGEANSDTCCGGGWIRKFSDGTTDWTITNRLSVDVQGFQCLNYKTPLMSENISDAVPAINGGTGTVPYYTSLSYLNSHVQRENGEFCIDPLGVAGGCSAWSFLSNTTEAPPTSSTHFLYEINTVNPNHTTGDQVWYFYKPLSADGDSRVVIDRYTDPANNSRQNLNFFLPIYVPDQVTDAWVNEVTPLGLSSYIFLVYEDGSPVGNHAGACYQSSGGTMGAFLDPKANEFTSGYEWTCPNQTWPTPQHSCCWSYNSTDRRLRIFLNREGSIAADKKMGVRLRVTSPSSVAAVGASGFQNTLYRTTKPGNDLYYLNRLGRLELSGIPQIVHQPLTCNNNANRLVPGLYKPTVKFYRYDQQTPPSNDTTTATFRHPENSFYSDHETSTSQYPYLTDKPHYTNYKGLATDPVFSDKDFKCCTPLGKETKSTTTCCSGFGVETTTAGKFKCMLPTGTDLSVYFNRFVSNEGRGADQPGGGLVDADFEAKTGEPKIANSVNAKLSTLGSVYCVGGKTRQGAAFGSFKPEPIGPRTQTANLVYGIVDSSNDSGNGSNAGQTVRTGYAPFSEGFRWNHHLYCFE
jgi:hypothetical protein